jgi:hypothetical protein
MHLPRFLQFFFACTMHIFCIMHDFLSSRRSPLFPIFGVCMGVSSSCPALLTPLEHPRQQMGWYMCIINHMWFLSIQHCPTRSSILVDCCFNIAVHCCIPPGAGGVDQPKFLVEAVPLHKLGLMGCENYPCPYPPRPTRLLPSVDCCVVHLHAYRIAKGCDESKSPSECNIIERLECGLWAMKLFPTRPRSRHAFSPASWLLFCFDVGCPIPPRAVEMSIDMWKSMTWARQNDVAAIGVVRIFRP